MSSFGQQKFGAVSAVKEKQRPLRRRFVSYALEIGEEGFLELVDRYEEWDSLSRTYVNKEVRTVLSERLASQINPNDWQEIADYCSMLRQEIDSVGLKMFFDPIGSGTLRAKWRYKLKNRTCTDYIRVIEDEDSKTDSYEADPDTIPSWLVRLVQRNYSYHLTAEWRNWFGRKMQRKREEIIMGVIFEKYRV